MKQSKKQSKKEAGIKAWDLQTFRSKMVEYINEDVLVDLYLALDSIAFNCYAYDISWHEYCKIDAGGIYISTHDYEEIKRLAEEGNSYAKWVIELIEKLTNPKSLLILRIKRLLETGTFHVKLNSAPENGYILVCKGNTIYEIEEELVKRIAEIDEEVKKVYERWQERMKKWKDNIPKILETFKHYSLRRVRFELRDASQSVI
jgi:hypothetical protein